MHLRATSLSERFLAIEPSVVVSSQRVGIIFPYFREPSLAVLSSIAPIATRLLFTHVGPVAMQCLAASGRSFEVASRRRSS